MIKKIILLACITCSLSVFAQKNLTDGYVILETKDTVYGSLKNVAYFTKSSVKLYQSGEKQRYPRNILSQVNVGGDTYVKADRDCWTKGFYKK